jgi:hypothetical protein
MFLVCAGGASYGSLPGHARIPTFSRCADRLGQL